VNEDKAVRYHRLKRRAAVASLLVSAAVPVLLLVSGGAQGLAAAVEEAGGSWVIPLVLYAGVFALLHEIGVLPLAYYGFRLDRRYGLSSQSRAEWFRDHLKAVVLAGFVVLGGSGILYGAIRIWPGWWWLPAAAVYTLVTVVLARLFPTLLLPWFYRFVPLDRPELLERLRRLSDKAGVPVVGAFEWGLGSKSRTANAAVVGLGASRRILVSDTMLAEYSDDEIEVVLAHEIAHHVHGDLTKALAIESALLLAATAAVHATLTHVGPLVGVVRPTDLAGLPLAALAAGAVFLLATPLVFAISRANERRADDYALRLTGGSAAFVSAMRRLAAQNLAETAPPRVAVWLFHSHPPVDERIARAAAGERLD
jgi:STE24 endopeptidase